MNVFSQVGSGGTWRDGRAGPRWRMT